MSWLGYRAEDSTIEIYFTTHDGSGGAVAPSDAFEAADVRIYKDGSATQKATTNGLTMTSPFDSITGLHLLSIDTSNDTGDSGFWEDGGRYSVVLSPDTETVDSQTVIRVVGEFILGRASVDATYIGGQAVGLSSDNRLRVDVAEWNDVPLATTNPLPNAAPNDPNGLPISVAGGLDIDTLLGTLTSLSAATRDANILDQFRRLIAVVEHQRGAHTHQPIGNIFFVDPTNGDTHANGNRGGISDPYSLVQDCHDNAVTDSNHDLIILLSGASGGPTTLTEAVTLSKRYLFIRGPGRDFIWTRSGAGDTITITADGIELSGFQVNTAATGTGNGITVTSADFFKAQHLWLNNTQGDAIQLTDCDNFIIHHCVLQGSGQSGSGHGIQVLAGAGQTSSYGQIHHSYLLDVDGDGIQIDTTGGGTVDNTLIHDNVIEGCTDDGIDIVDAGCTGTVILKNAFANVTGNNIEDAGTSTVTTGNEQWATATALATAQTGITTIQAITDAIGATAAANLAKTLGNSGVINGTVDTVTNTHTPTTTEFQADDITEATNDHYNGRVVIWLTGALAGQATDITDYTTVGGIGQFTVTALTEAPANNDTFVII